MMKKGFFLSWILAAVLLLGACGKSESSGSAVKGHNKVKVVTTYSIIYDIVKNVGGDRVEVHSLAPIGSNPMNMIRFRKMFKKQLMPMSFFTMD
jgi:iron/zinc/copper transport system substrate-binding protein